MKYIYVMTNRINGKKYVGQTNNFNLRMNGHKSDAFNPHSHSYNYPLSRAIRKYGWENFDNCIVEEINDEEDFKYVDSREKFFIQYYNSMKSKNGYNITTGGAGCPKPNLTFKERVGLSKLFSLLDILDIQNRMIKGEKSSTIIKDYPKLTRSMFDNINLGLNFKNENLEYPLHNYRKDLSIKFTIEEIHAIKKEIIEKKTPFKEIAEKWEVSLSTISLVNNGKQWYEEQYTYPLRYGNSNYIYNANTWVKDVQDDLLHSSLPMTEIAKKYNKAYSTIKKINSGASHKKEIYRYPLTSNRT